MIKQFTREHLRYRVKSYEMIEIYKEKSTFLPIVNKARVKMFTMIYWQKGACVICFTILYYHDTTPKKNQSPF